MKKRKRYLAVCLFLLAWAPLTPETARAQLVYDDPVFEWKDNRDPEAPRPSPNTFVGLQIGSTRVMIAYGSLGVKGREIFGSLLPYGVLWRTGANEATTITFTGDVLIEGHDVPAGTYSLFTIPDEQEWTIIFNKENNQWGAFGYKEKEDVLRITAPAQEAPFRENLAFGFEQVDPDGFSASVVLNWEKTRVVFKVEEP